MFINKIGKMQKRYIYHSLPNKINFEENSFDLGLSSHFLLLYDDLGLDFHLQSITEILRVCKEVRLFPTINLLGNKSLMLDPMIDFLMKEKHFVELIPVTYGFNGLGFEMLKISKMKQND